VGWLVLPSTQPIDEQSGDRRTRKAKERPGQRNRTGGDNTENCSECGAARDTKDVRICQGISQQCLKGRSRDGKRRSDTEGESNSWKPQTKENDLLFSRKGRWTASNPGPESRSNQAGSDVLASKTQRQGGDQQCEQCEAGDD
jgi:hypothetical protein